MKSLCGWRHGPISNRGFSRRNAGRGQTLYVLLGYALLGCIFVAGAAEFTSVQDGLWRDPTTWSVSGGLGSFPSAGDTARIQHQITVQNPESVAQLIMQGGSLIVQIGASVSATDTSVVYAATLSGGGVFQNKGTMTITGAPPTWIDLWLENEGKMNLVQTPSLQLTGDILNKTMALVRVEGPGTMEIEGGGALRNNGNLFVGNNTTMKCLNAKFFVNGGTINLGTGAMLRVRGQGETNALVHVNSETQACFFVVDGGTSRYDGVLSGTGPGVLRVETGVVMFGWNSFTNPVLNVQGGGFQWAGGTMNIYPASQLENHGNLVFVPMPNAGGTCMPVLVNGALRNKGTIVMMTSSGTNALVQIAPGYDFSNSETGRVVFAGGYSEFTGSGCFRNSGDVVFAQNTTGRIGMTFFQYQGTFSVHQASAQLPNGFVMYNGRVNLNGGDWGGASFWIMGGSVQAQGAMRGNTYHSSGTISPGQSPGSVAAEGFYSQSGTGNLLIELGGETPGTGYDQLNVQQYASLGGHLTVELYGGYDPLVGRRFDILTASSVSNAFAVTNLPALSGDRQWLVLYRTNGVQLRVASSQDTDGDNLADVWELLHFGDLATSDGGEYDFDGDGYSDFFEQLCDTQPTNNTDYLRWKFVSLGSGGAELTIHTGSNATYTVDAAADLSDAAWEIVDQFAGTGGDLVRTNAPSGTNRFFRIRARP